MCKISKRSFFLERVCTTSGRRISVITAGNCDDDYNIPFFILSFFIITQCTQFWAVVSQPPAMSIRSGHWRQSVHLTGQVYHWDAEHKCMSHKLQQSTKYCSKTVLSDTYIAIRIHSVCCVENQLRFHFKKFPCIPNWWFIAQ